MICWKQPSTGSSQRKTPALNWSVYIRHLVCDMTLGPREAAPRSLSPPPKRPWAGRSRFPPKVASRNVHNSSPGISSGPFRPRSPQFPAAHPNAHRQEAVPLLASEAKSRSWSDNPPSDRTRFPWPVRECLPTARAGPPSLCPTCEDARAVPPLPSLSPSSQMTRTQTHHPPHGIRLRSCFRWHNTRRR